MLVLLCSSHFLPRLPAEHKWPGKQGIGWRSLQEAGPAGWGSELGLAKPQPRAGCVRLLLRRQAWREDAWFGSQKTHL